MQYTHARTHARTHAQIRTHTTQHTYIYISNITHLNASNENPIQSAWTLRYYQLYIHTYIYTCAHTHTHTHTYTHIHTQKIYILPSATLSHPLFLSCNNNQSAKKLNKDSRVAHNTQECRKKKMTTRKAGEETINEMPSRTGCVPICSASQSHDTISGFAYTWKICHWDKKSISVT